jgi:hypothetical protein
MRTSGLAIGRFAARLHGLDLRSELNVIPSFDDKYPPLRRARASSLRRRASDLCVTAMGLKTVCPSCQNCGHEAAILNITDAPDNRPLPDISLRLCCSRCNSRDICMAMDMAEYYRVLHATTGWQPP